MTTKTKLAPMTIKVENNKVLCNKNGKKFVDLLSDLGWDYQCMTSSNINVESFFSSSHLQNPPIELNRRKMFCHNHT